jgi:hypothetical protein
MFEKWVEFNKSKPGIILLFVASVFMLVLTSAYLIKNIEHPSKVIYFSISGFAMSALGFLTGIRRLRDLNAKNDG